MLSTPTSCLLQRDEASGTKVEKMEKTPSTVPVTGHLSFCPQDLLRLGVTWRPVQCGKPLRNRWSSSTLGSLFLSFLPPPHHPQGQTVHTGSAGFGGPTPITLLTWCHEATGRALGREGVLWGPKEREETQRQKSLEKGSPSTTTEPVPAADSPAKRQRRKTYTRICSYSTNEQQT